MNAHTELEKTCTLCDMWINIDTKVITLTPLTLVCLFSNVNTLFGDSWDLLSSLSGYITHPVCSGVCVGGGGHRHLFKIYLKYYLFILIVFHCKLFINFIKVD